MTHTEKHNLNETIEFQIKRIEAQENRAGWNTWILTGALVTTISILFAELEKGPFNLNSTIYLFLGWSLVYDWIRMIISEFSWSNQGPAKIYPANEIFSLGIVGFVFVILRSTSLIGLGFYTLSYINSSRNLWIFMFFYFIYLIGFMIKLIISYTNSPVITNHRTWIDRTVIWIFLLSLPYLVIDIGKQILWGNILTSPHDFRISGLMAIAISIINLLAERQVMVKLISRLESLYNGYNLGVTTEMDAQKTLIYLLAGMSPTNYFEKDYELVIKSINTHDPVKIRNSAIAYMQKLLQITALSTEFKPEVETLVDKFKAEMASLPVEIKEKVENIWYKTYFDYVNSRFSGA